MTPGPVSKKVVVGRLSLVDDLLHRIRDLLLNDVDAFLADPRNVGAAESFLRRSLEALLDVGRHVLAKGYGRPVSEYKEIAAELQREAVLSQEEASMLRMLAGYRNRLVHFYHDVSPRELFEICSGQLPDVERVSDAFRHWMKKQAAEQST
jgi:uncharacterized protein YutE (UPF0331/DUF86 family)